MFELLDEVVQLLFDRQVVAPRVKSVNVDRVKPDQVLQTVGQSDLCRDRGRRREVIHDLTRLEVVVLDVLGHERPQEVKTGRVFLLVLDPAALLQCLLDIAVAALDDEHLRVGVDPVLLLPLLHVRDVQLHRLNVGLVTLQEVVECFRVLHHRLDRWLTWRRTRDHLSILTITAVLLEATILLFPERGHILDLFRSLDDSLPRLILQLLLPILLPELLLLFLGDFLPDRRQLLLLTLPDGLGSCLFLSGLFQDLFLPLLIEL